MGNEENVAATLYHGPTGRKLARVILEELKFQPDHVGSNQIQRHFKLIDASAGSRWPDQVEVFVRSVSGWQAVARVTSWPGQGGHGIMEFV